MCVPVQASTRAGNPNGPEPANANDDQGQPEGIATFASANVPFSGLAVPTTVILSYVPFHLGAGQVGFLVCSAIFFIDLPL